MNKLVKKLKELGYEGQFEEEEPPLYYKTINGYDIIIVDFFTEIECYVDPSYKIETQEQIDNLQQAFNQMQKDLEELGNVESEK